MAYLRVSTAMQETEKGKARCLLLADERGWGQVAFVEEVASSRIAWQKRAIGAIIAGRQGGPARRPG